MILSTTEENTTVRNLKEFEVLSMKRLIVSSNNITEWNIVAYFEAADESSLAANTKIVPLKDENGQLDQQALTQWNTFIDNVVSYIEYLDFEVIDNHSSNRASSYSHYTSFYPVDREGNLKGEYLINFRISDHVVNHLKKKSRYYYQNLAKRNKRSEGEKQKFRLVAVTVNNETFETYEQALSYIEKQLENLR